MHKTSSGNSCNCRQSCFFGECNEISGVSRVLGDSDPRAWEKSFRGYERQNGSNLAFSWHQETPCFHRWGNGWPRKRRTGPDSYAFISYHPQGTQPTSLAYYLHKQWCQACS